MQVDDVVDAIAVHAGCGAWGMIAGATFADKELVSFVYGEVSLLPCFIGFLLIPPALCGSEGMCHALQPVSHGGCLASF